MAEPISTAQLIARDNINQLRNARNPIQREVVVPDKFNLGTASNPIAMISSGLEGMGQAFGAPERRQAEQTNLDAATALQQEEQDYSRAQDANLAADRQAQMAQNQANMDRNFQQTLASAQQQQSNADRGFQLKLDVIKKSEDREADADTVKSNLSDAVFGFQEMLQHNARLVQLGQDDGKSFDQLTRDKNALIKAEKERNDKDKNVGNDTDVIALDNMLTTALSKTHKLDERSNADLTQYTTGRKLVLDQDLADEATALKADLIPIDGVVSEIAKLKTDGKVQDGINHAFNTMVIPEGVDEEELLTSAKKVVAAVEDKYPEYAKSDYWNAIISTAIAKTHTANALWRDSDDFTSSAGLFMSGLNSDLGLNIIKLYKQVKQNEVHLIKNTKAQKASISRTRKLNSNYAKDIVGKTSELELLQGFKD